MSADMTAQASTRPGNGVSGGSVLADTMTLAKRSFRHWQLQPGVFVTTLLFPVFTMLLMTGLIGGAVSGSTSDYIPFVVAGTLALAMLFGVEATMIAATSDITRKVTDRFRAMPISMLSLLLGRAVADMAASVLTLVVMTFAGLALGWRWEAGVADALIAYGLLLLLRFGLVWFALFVAIRAGSPEAVAAAQILVWPIGLLSTVFIDIDTMPSWLAHVASWNPLSATASACRELFSGTAGTGYWPVENATLLAVLWPIALCLVFVPLSVRALRDLAR